MLFFYKNMLFTGYYMKFYNLVEKKSITEDIEKMLRTMEQSLRVYITLHDRLGVFFRENGTTALPGGRNMHACPYCKAGRFTEPKWNSYCPRDCFLRSDELAIREGRPFTTTCWKGVFELVIPIMRSNATALILYAGGWQGKIPKTTKLPDKYRKMHGQLPDIPTEKDIVNLIHVLSAFGQGLISRMDMLAPSDSERSGRRESIMQFIHENAHRQIKLEDLAKHLFLSPSRTSHIVNQNFAMPFKKILIRERMSRARNLLQEEWLNIGAIAEAVGYDNVYYFNTAFKKWYGMPPGRFRRQQLTGSDRASDK
jgi:AraC-like DNA-binding protein